MATAEKKGSPAKLRFAAAGVTQLIMRLSCPQGVFIPLTEHYGVVDETLRTSLRIFAGGVGHTGDSVCGVVSGGILAGGAIVWRDVTSLSQKQRRELILQISGRYLDDLAASCSSYICHEKVKTDFFSISDLLRYFIFFRWSKCVGMSFRAAASMSSILADLRIAKPAVDAPLERPQPELVAASCALSVLEETLPDDNETITLRGASQGFDGGLGLRGSVCGALLAACLSIGYAQTKLGSHSGYGVWGNILDEIYPNRIYIRVASLLKDFVQEFGSLDCRTQTEKKFVDAASLALHLKEGGCGRIMDFCREKAK